MFLLFLVILSEQILFEVSVFLFFFLIQRFVLVIQLYPVFRIMERCLDHFGRREFLFSASLINISNIMYNFICYICCVPVLIVFCLSAPQSTLIDTQEKPQRKIQSPFQLKACNNTKIAWRCVNMQFWVTWRQRFESISLIYGVGQHHMSTKGCKIRAYFKHMFGPKFKSLCLS